LAGCFFAQIPTRGRHVSKFFAPYFSAQDISFYNRSFNSYPKMKKTFLWCAASLIAATMASTALASPFFTEDFEGSPVTGWVFINGTQTNKWVTGTPTDPAPGTNLTAFAYISNGTGDNPANAYTIAATPSATSTVHLYRDIAFVGNGIDPFKVSFDWRAYGESTFDFLRVFVVDTSTTPVAGTQQVGALGIFNVSKGGSSSTWNHGAVWLPASYAGTTKRLVFSWRNDNSGGDQPPAAIDSIAIEAIPMASYEVSIAGTSGAGSLHQAITDANTAGGGIINVANSVGSITLSATLPAITGTITINGNGVTISGNKTCRIMTINDGAALSANRVRFDNGSVSGSGGAIYNKCRHR
jgi:hypothetical protein